MSADKVVYALLSGAGGVTSLVGGAGDPRIYAVVLPQGKVFPAITFEVISAQRIGAMDAYAPSHLTRSRVQVNALAQNHPAVVALIEAIKAALQFQRGTFNGITTHSVLHAGEGPEQYDQQLGVFLQPIDFFVTHEAT